VTATREAVVGGARQKCHAPLSVEDILVVYNLHVCSFSYINAYIRHEYCMTISLADWRDEALLSQGLGLIYTHVRT
jgi:hypothetical protein